MGRSQGSARARASWSRGGVRLLLWSGLFWLAGQAAADATSPDAQGHCEIRFFGSSTLHDFSGEVRSQPFALAFHVDASDVRGWWSGSIQVAVAEMDTGIERRDRKMRAMFEADRFPLIVADFPRLGSAALARVRSSGESDLEFDLTIRETTRPVAARVSNWTETGPRASFDAEFELSLEAFGLEPPTVFGLIRVKDAVVVRAHVILDGLPVDARGNAALGASPRSPAFGS